MIRDFNSLVAKIDKVMAKREEYYPELRRDPQLAVEIEECTTEFVGHFLAHQELEQQWQPAENILEHALSIVQNPVFICGPMKSGTSLLLQLLDGHPYLIAWPGDSFYAKHLTTNFLQDRQWREIIPYRFPRLIIRKNLVWYFPKQEAPFLNYIRYLIHYLEHTTYDRYTCEMLALLSANPHRSGKERMWIEKTPNNEYHARNLLAPRYRNSKFIHIIREPLADSVSIKRTLETRGKKYQPIGMSYYLQNSQRLALENQGLLGKDRYLILDYEDLVADTGREMGRVAEFLGIEFGESMLAPTENHQPITANTMFKSHKLVGKVGNFAGDDKWVKHLSFYEKFCIINLLAGDALFERYDWNRPATRKYHIPVVGNLFVRIIGRLLIAFRRKRVNR